MDIDGLPIIGPGVDYTQVGAIHQKRTLAFINHFISTTVSFMNKFARSCEQRLEKFDARIQKVDASLSILEAKLSSISGLENVSISDNTVPSFNQPSTEVVISSEEMPKTIAENLTQAETLQTKAQDPRFNKFFRMVQVGVPIQAVRLKMQAEGLDPEILNDPDGVTTSVPDDESLKSDSSFSD